MCNGGEWEGSEGGEGAPGSPEGSVIDIEGILASDMRVLLGISIRGRSGRVIPEGGGTRRLGAVSGVGG